jgi:hypothetical protein
MSLEREHSPPTTTTIDDQKARDLLARHGARYFGPVRLVTGLGLARHGACAVLGNDFGSLG